MKAEHFIHGITSQKHGSYPVNMDQRLIIMRKRSNEELVSHQRTAKSDFTNEKPRPCNHVIISNTFITHSSLI